MGSTKTAVRKWTEAGLLPLLREVVRKPADGKIHAVEELMKVDLETQEIEAIATKVVEMLKPHLMGNAKQEDKVFDKQGLADYLHVDVSWVNKQITNRAFRIHKVGKYTRFKKSVIDAWMDSNSLDPIPELASYRRRQSS